MKKPGFLYSIILPAVFCAGIANAQIFEASLSAGASTVQGGFDVNHNMGQGNLCTGLSGIYTNPNDGKLKLLEGHMKVDNELLLDGLSGELGIKGLVGSIEKKGRKGDIGGLGFIIGGTYQLPKKTFMVSTKVFTELCWSPSPLAFVDMNRYFDVKIGADLFLIENAALEIAYQHYTVGMKSGPGDWSRKDNIVTVGIKLRF
jgi:hypothetical protein